MLSVVPKDYKVVQPREILEFFRDEVESGGLQIDTAGVLDEGRKLWTLATNATLFFAGLGQGGVSARGVQLPSVALFVCAKPSRYLG